MATIEDLRRMLARIDQRGYPAYRDIQGEYATGDLTLHVDRVQPDPFAPPSRLRTRVAMTTARVPAELCATRARRIALADWMARRAARAASAGRIDALRIDAGGQEVLERSAVAIAPDWIELRLEASLPAAGRRILGRAAERLLCDLVPRVVDESLLWRADSGEDARRFIACVEEQEEIRARLGDLGLIAFVGNGAILPRASGRSDAPMSAAEAIPFVAPPSLEVTLDLSAGRRITGMGISRGVTLIVGGGYHGKSTLLAALERGVYPHVPGDGRDLVVSAPDLVKIRAEDGRRVEAVDIRAFIGDLPGGRSTASFSSEDASGSTSQAASIVEAIEAGARGLLLDEDTSATNFMIRDVRMQALVGREHEPITPFVERVRELHEKLGVSTVLVMGGSGDYLDVADRVLLMRDFRAIDATADAREVVARHRSERQREAREVPLGAAGRAPLRSSFDRGEERRSARVDAKGLDRLVYGSQTVDLRALEQLVDPSQTRAIGRAIALAARGLVDGETSLADLLAQLEELLDRDGLDVLDLDASEARSTSARTTRRHPGNLARPRRFEIAAAINRMPALRVRPR